MLKKIPDALRANYELEVLQDTVFHTRTKEETMRAAIRFAYDQVLAERIANTSTTMRTNLTQAG